MKRIFSLAMIIALALSSLVLTASATDSAFISSPSAVAAPILIEYDVEDDKCEAEILICAYADRALLDADARTKLEDAYASIIAADDVFKLCPKLEEEVDYSSDVLAVSDLFDVYYRNCDVHEDHIGVTVTLRPRVAENFVAILHYVDGQWVHVKNAYIEDNGKDLTFVVDTLSPFAIVLHDGTTPPVDDSVSVPLILAFSFLFLLLLIIIILIIMSSKKKTQTKPENK